MKKFFQIVGIIAFLMAFAPVQAHADCFRNTYEIPRGSPPVVLTNGLWCTQGSVVGGQYAVQQPYQQQYQQQLMAQAIRVSAGSRAPQGYCSWGGRIENVLISALIGGGIGVLAGDNRQSANKGAAAGAVAGLFVPCDSLQQAQQSSSYQPQQVAMQQQFNTGNSCVRGGRKYDCNDKLVVVRASGDIACRPSSATAEPGEKICTGIQ